MKKNLSGGLAIGFLMTSILGTAGMANASLMLFYNSTAWNAALNNTPVVETFNGLSDSQHASLELSGLTFTSSTRFDAMNSDPLTLWTTGTTLVASQGGSSIKAEWTTPKTAVGADLFTWMYDADINVWVTVVENNSPTTYFTSVGPFTNYYSIDSSLSPGNFFGLIADTGYISSIEFLPNSPELGTQNNYWQSIGIDNFSSVNSPVPEPATMLLFGTGIVGLIVAQRKKRFHPTKSQFVS